MPVARVSSIRRATPPVSRTDFVRENLKEAILSGENEIGSGSAEASMTNRLFHRALYAGRGNPLLAEILDGLRDQAALITVTGSGVCPTWQEADRAERLLRQHITNFIDRVALGLPGARTPGDEQGA
jgi:DNA-binding FadR family transcriptional regulator